MSFLLMGHAVVVVMFTLRILLRDDLSSPARLAWFVVLCVLPVAGTVLYFLFGEIDLGQKSVARRVAIVNSVRQYAERFLFQSDQTATLIVPLYQAPFRYAQSVNGFGAVGGNSAELMADAATTRQRMVSDIDAATDHVHVLYYIWLEDGTGTELAEALIRAAGRGVTCRAMADGLGSRAMIRSRLWERMKEAGVHVAVALPLDKLIHTLLTSRIDLRNHRKITVIDGNITYCGSQNSADPEFLVKAKFAPWVDIMLRFEGPVVTQNQLIFASDWICATDEPLEDLPLRAIESDAGFAAQAVGFGPTGRRGSTPQLFATAFNSAHSTITLSTPYFVPDATALEALCAAALRGVVVTLIFPKVNDSWIVAAASHSYYRRLLEAGCHIFEFTDGLLHAKTLTIDGCFSLIGSSNLDLRSFDLNYENNILLQDKDITEEIEQRQAVYIQQSRSVHMKDVMSWHYHRRIWNNVVATIGPIL